MITIFVAVVTPDGSGITMRFVALPIIALYALGITAIRGNEMNVTERQKN
jgi:sec-independent protein translocase protein TatC